MPSIIVNGVPREISAGSTLRQLVELLQLDSRQIAIERNREIVGKNRYNETMLCEGDRLEIVTFVGGG